MIYKNYVILKWVNKLKKKIIIPFITTLLFIVGYIFAYLNNYTFTTFTTYLFLFILFIELLFPIEINKKDTILFRVVTSIAYIFIYSFIMIVLLSTYGYDVRLKNNYVIRKSLLDVKPVREIAKSPNIFIKSKNKEYCHLIDGMCD